MRMKSDPCLPELTAQDQGREVSQPGPQCTRTTVALCVPSPHQGRAGRLGREHTRREGRGRNHTFIPRSTQMYKQFPPEINTLSLQVCMLIT